MWTVFFVIAGLGLAYYLYQKRANVVYAARVLHKGRYDDGAKQGPQQ